MVELWRWTEPKDTSLSGIEVTHHIGSDPRTPRPGFTLPTQNRCLGICKLGQSYPSSVMTISGTQSASCLRVSAQPNTTTTIYDKELLLVICGLEEWRHILEGTKHTIEILNNHRNLTYFRTAQMLNRHQAQLSHPLTSHNACL